MKCEHEGCNQTKEDMLTKCHILDYETGEEHDFVYCIEHAHNNGFCYICGDFWGGIENFDFNNPSKLCEHCLDQLEANVVTDHEEDYGIY